MARDPHRKLHPSSRTARNERRLLRLVAGDGVVVARGGHGREVLTEAGVGSLGDLLAERGRLAEHEARGIGAWVAHALGRLHADGIVHGDVKPANIVFGADGDLRLIDFDAAGEFGAARTRGTPERGGIRGPLRPEDDVRAVALMVVECSTSVLVDPSTTWSSRDLLALGCPSDLAADCAVILCDVPPADRVAGILQRRNDRIPAPPRRGGSPDPTPTVDIPSVALRGLSPSGSSSPVPHAVRRGRRWRGAGGPG